MRKLFGCLVRLVVIGAIVVFIVYYFAPPLWDKVGSSLLNSINNSAASGIAQFIPANFSDGNSYLQVSVQGLTPGTNYFVTLDPDACPSSLVQDVGPVVADSSGSISAQLKMPKNVQLNGRTWWVDVRLSNDGGASVACGKLQFNNSIIAQDATPTQLDTGSGSFSVNLGPVTPTPVPATDTTPLTTNGQPSSTPTTQTPKGWPNTGVNPGNLNGYDNNSYPRKY